MLQFFIENNADPIYYLDTKLLELIINELKGHILELAKDQYGTLILQVIISKTDPSIITFFFNFLVLSYKHKG